MSSRTSCSPCGSASAASIAARVPGRPTESGTGNPGSGTLPRSGTRGRLRRVATIGTAGCDVLSLIGRSLGSSRSRCANAGPNEIAAPATSRVTGAACFAIRDWLFEIDGHGLALARRHHDFGAAFQPVALDLDAIGAGREIADRRGIAGTRGARFVPFVADLGVSHRQELERAIVPRLARHHDRSRAQGVEIDVRSDLALLDADRRALVRRHAAADLDVVIPGLEVADLVVA